MSSMWLLVGIGAGVAGWCAAAVAPAFWREAWVPWWYEEVARHLDLGGHRKAAQNPHVPLLALVPLTLLGGLLDGARGAALVLLAGVTILPALPTLLSAWIQSKVEQADRQLLSLLPELAAGIRRDEPLVALLDRLFEQVTRDRGLSDDARFSPLMVALLRDAAAASRLSPALTNVCDTLGRSPLPTAWLVAQAWRQKPKGSDVPASLHFIAETVASDYAFQDEIDRKISPVKAEGWLMVAMPLAMVALLTRGEPEALQRLLQPPTVLGPIAAVGLTLVSRVYLRSVLGSMQ